MNKRSKYIKAPAPLLCWDIFIERYHRRLNLGGDIMALNKLAVKAKWQHNFDFDEQLIGNDKTILVTDPSLHIIYATANMPAMNGYNIQEVLGKTPKIFQGKETSENDRKLISQSVKNKLPFEATVINYRKNGDIYHCHIEGYPIFNLQGELVNFIAFENAA